MLERKISIILISQIFVFSFCGQLFDRKAIQITRLDGQCRGKNVSIATYYKGVKCDTRSAFIENSTVVIKENLTNNLKCTMVIHRCQTRENLDSCEEFYKRDNVNICQLINPDNVMIAQSPLAVHYKPKLKCPGKKGVYQAHNFTLSLTPFITTTVVDGWYWKIEFNIYTSGTSRLISCTRIEGYTVLV